MNRTTEAITGLAIGVAATVLNRLRLPSSSSDTMYAEDGARFLHDALVNGPVALVTPYAGYQHFVPRVSAFVISSFAPVTTWANAMIWTACAVVGVIAALVWWSTATLDLPLVSRLALAAIPVLAPVAGVESIGNIGNVHWYFLYLMPWLLVTRPGGRTLSVLVAAVTFVGVITEIQTLLLAPMAAYLLLKGRPQRLTGIAYGLGAIVQTLTYLTQGRSGGAGYPGPTAVLRGFLFNGFLGGASAHVGVNRQIVNAAGWTVIALACALLVAVTVGLLVQQPGLPRALAVVLPIAAIGSWSIAHIYNNYPSLNFESGPFKLARWGTASAMLLWALVPLAFGTVDRRWLQWASAVGLVALMGSSFVVPNSRHGIYWHTEIRRAQVECRTTAANTARVKTLPPDWYFEIPCSALRRQSQTGS